MRIAILVLLLLASPLKAAVVIKQEFGNSGAFTAIGIQGLNVNGVLYDVDFTSGYETFNELFGTGNPPSISVPTFYFDSTGAAAALVAIRTAFNSEAVIPYHVGPLSAPTNYVSVPTNSGGSDTYYNALTLGKDNDAPFQTYWAPSQAYGGILPREYFMGNLIARFYLSEENNLPAPEPTTLTLWSLGALGCAFGAYRRRRAG